MSKNEKFIVGTNYLRSTKILLQGEPFQAIILKGLNGLVKVIPNNTWPS